MGRRYRRVTAELRVQIRQAAVEGWSHQQIVERLDTSQGTVGRVLARIGGSPGDVTWQPGPRHLSLDERIEIYVGLENALSVRAIAGRLDRCASTVWREIDRNGGAREYRPMRAHRRAHRQARRPKVTKLACHPVLCQRVIADLQRLWSPQQISRRLRADFGDDPAMNVSPETIYQSLYVQGRGELRRELARCLRSGRAKRRPRGRLDHRRSIAGMVMISARPAEADDRAVPGHWEGDLILGRNGRSQIGTLVERSTRFVMLLHLPDARTADQVQSAMAAAIQTLPAALRRSVTWDQGKEMARHREFTIATGVQIYFCDPHSPWQRGSNENTNGLLRQYFPKGTDLSLHTPHDLQAAADSLNGRPRKTLDWMTPSEKLAEMLQ